MKKKDLSKKILWISLMAPYDTVSHAGGKIENYYLKKAHSSHELDLMLVTFCKEDEVSKLDLELH